MYSRIMVHLDRNNILVHYQHGDRAVHSCKSQLINEIGNIVPSFKEIMQKGHDSRFVPHKRLLLKLNRNGDWSYQTSRVG